jgi:hypothetical protein
MINHAVIFAPLRLATCALIIVTRFRFHNAHIAAGEFFHAYKTVTLGIALLSLFPTRATKNVARVSKGDALADKRFEIDEFFANRKTIVNLTI